MGLIKIKTYSLYVETYGNPKNTPILFLHGGPGDGCMLLSELAKKLSKDYYTICFDQFGCGRSGDIAEGENFGLVKQLNVINELRKYLFLDKVTLYGHGYGGVLACLYANKFSQNVESIIYDCPTWNFSDSVKSITKYLFQESFIYKDKNSTAYRLCSEIMDKVYREGDTRCIEDIEKLLKYVEDPSIRFYLHQKRFECFKSIFKNLVAEDEKSLVKEKVFLQKLIDEGMVCNNFCSVLKENKQPSLLISGKYDPICTLEQKKAFIEFSQNGELAIFEDSGAFPHLEEEEMHYFSVVDFIKRNNDKAKSQKKMGCSYD